MRTSNHFSCFLALAFAVASPLLLRAVDPEPFTLPTGFSFKITGSGSATMTVYDATSPAVSYTIGTDTESPAGTAYLKPGKPYDLNISSGGGTAVTEYSLSLVAPSGYQFYVGGIPKDMIKVTGISAAFNTTYTIQLRPQDGEGIMRAGDFTGIDLGQSVSWELGLGTTQAGKTVGRIGFRELDLSTSPAARERLFFTPRYDSESVNIRWDGPSSTRIRQVVSPRTMIDLVDVTDGYEIRYYNYDDTTFNGYPALYTINSGKTPWHTISVEAPSGTTNQLRITEKEETTTVRVSHLTLASGSISSGAYVWTLQEGGTGGAWLRTTTHSSTVNSGVRENVVVVREGGTSGTIVSETKYVYHIYAWGEDLYQVIANPNGGSGTVATTTYDYYTTAPSSGSETHRGNFRRVKSVSHTSGGWTAFEYYDEWEKRGQTKYAYQPFQDSPSSVSLDPTLGRVVYSEYGADSSGRHRLSTLRQEKINNVMTAKTVWTYDGSSSSPARVKADVDLFYATGSSYIRTRSEILDPIQATDLDQAGEPVVVKNPDGTQTSWSRANGDFDLSTRAFSNAGGSGIYWRILKVTGTSVAGTANGAESSTRNSFDGQSFDALYLVPYKSTMEVVILDYAGLPLRTESRVYTGSGNWSVALSTNDSAYDFTRTNRLTGVTAGNGAATAYTYTNGRLSSTVADGLETQFTYDALGRTLTMTRIGASASGIHAAQADITTTYDYDEVDGSNYATKETLSATGESETIVSTKAFDRAGRVVKVTPPGLSATTVSYNVAARTQTTTAPAPDGGTTIQENYRDGSLKSTTGTAVVPVFYAYSTESDGRKVVQVNSGTSSSTRLQKTWTNWAGQSIKLEKPGFSQSSQAAYVEEQFYSTTTGRMTHTTRTGAAPTRYEYNALGQVKRSGLDVDSGGALVLASSDRIIDSDTVFELVSTTWWAKTTTTAYPFASSATAVTMSVAKQKLNGFSSGVRAESQSTDAEGNTVTSGTSVSGKLATTQTTVPGLTTDSYAYAYNGRASASTGHDGLTTKIAYDNLGRQSTTTDARSLVTTMAYCTGTALPYTTTDSASNVVSTIAYDTQGRTSWTRDAASKYTRFAYNERGQVIQQWGDATYPVAYAYDATYGDRTGMSTYRSAPVADSGSWPSVGTADTTTWNFDTPSGLLWKKTDADGKYVTMNYNQAGQTSRSTLARGVYTDYAYDSATGELLTQTYSDGTPTVTYTYTRSGQSDSVADHTGTWDYVYDSTKPWRQVSTTLPAFYGTRHYTALYESSGMVGRYLGFQVGSSVGSSADLEQVYVYSADGRFDTLTSKRSSNSVTRTFDYSYLSNTPFVSGLAITGGHNFTVTRGYESNRNLLASIEGKWGATPVTKYEYAHNALGQRTTAKQSGTAFADYYPGTAPSYTYSSVFNHYTYNARGELETAAMYRGDTPSTTPSSADELPGRRFEYRFDSIGNRKNDGPTGDPANMDDVYTTNALNQYTAKENNTVRVLGTAAAAASVGVTGAPSTGKKDRAWGADFVPANTSTAVAGTANIYAAVPGTGGAADLIKSENKAFFIPKGLQTFTYDDDGNLTQDSVWDYTYDAENRLTAMQNRSEVIGTGMIASADARRLEFKYDYQGRRVRKITYDWNGTTYSSTALTDTKYLYDGWNLIAEFTVGGGGSLTLAKAYTWGLDLTGSLTFSGGVGALLQTYDATAGKTLLHTYDGNGNVAALLNAETGSTLTLEAAYEYDPFGNPLRNEGAYAASNAFRFSTKFTDTETGLVYYGLRYYSPTLGRFINKDPIEEQGGLNLYGFVSNRVPNAWDYLGMVNLLSHDLFDPGDPGYESSRAGISAMQDAFDRLQSFDNHWGENDTGGSSKDLVTIIKEILSGGGSSGGAPSGSPPSVNTGPISSVAIIASNTPGNLIDLSGATASVSVNNTPAVTGAVFNVVDNNGNVVRITGAAANAYMGALMQDIGTNLGGSMSAGVANNYASLINAPDRFGDTVHNSLALAEFAMFGAMFEARVFAPIGTAENSAARILWPANQGFVAGEGGAASVLAGQILDRFGGTGGRFLAPEGTPLSARSLAPGTELKPLNSYKVLEPFEAGAGRTAPAFGQPGGGLQFDLGTKTVQDLIDAGVLRTK